MAEAADTGAQRLGELVGLGKAQAALTAEHSRLLRRKSYGLIPEISQILDASRGTRPRSLPQDLTEQAQQVCGNAPVAQFVGMVAVAPAAAVVDNAALMIGYIICPVLGGDLFFQGAKSLRTLVSCTDFGAHFSGQRITPFAEDPQHQALGPGSAGAFQHMVQVRRPLLIGALCAPPVIGAELQHQQLGLQVQRLFLQELARLLQCAAVYGSVDEVVSGKTGRQQVADPSPGAAALA